MTPELVFSQHLLRAMARRKVTREEVEVTVFHPDEVRDTVSPETGRLGDWETEHPAHTDYVRWQDVEGLACPATAWRGLDREVDSMERH